MEVYHRINDRDSYHLIMSMMTLKNTFVQTNDESVIITLKPVHDVFAAPTTNQTSDEYVYCVEQAPQYCTNVSTFSKRARNTRS